MAETGSVLRLSPRAIRVLHNVADAWFPPDAARPGGGDVDLAPGVEARLRGRRERFALEVGLRALEWQPLLRLRSRRGFAWLPRSERRRLLGAWEGSRLGFRRRLAVRLHAVLDAAYEETAAHSSPDGA